MKPYEALIVRTPKIVPGVFRCGGNSGLRIEILEDTHSVQIKMLFGSNQTPTYIGHNTAKVLRDFFADLAEIL